MQNKLPSNPKISESDLILNKDGSVYHLGLKPEHLTDTIITVGDPERVSQVSKYFDRVEAKISRREFVSHKGVFQGKEILVVSSGIGTDNVEILLTELDILANIDLEKRVPHTSVRKLNIIRIGTSGAIQPAVPLDSFLVSEFAIGLDTLPRFYKIQYQEQELAIAQTFATQIGLNFSPYCVQGSAILKQKFAADMRMGNTLTCPGFYAPQGRKIRGNPVITDFFERVNNFNFHGFKLTNFEMETAGYYALGRLLGHEVLSLNAIIVQRVQQVFSRNPEKVINDLITKTLERI